MYGLITVIHLPTNRTVKLHPYQGIAMANNSDNKDFSKILSLDSALLTAESKYNMLN
jgi:hypothetical protein